mgnify:FL=1|jgi:hypothetical protein
MATLFFVMFMGVFHASKQQESILLSYSVEHNHVDDCEKSGTSLIVNSKIQRNTIAKSLPSEFHESSLAVTHVAVFVEDQFLLLAEHPRVIFHPPIS